MNAFREQQLNQTKSGNSLAGADADWTLEQQLRSGRNRGEEVTVRQRAALHWTALRIGE